MIAGSTPARLTAAVEAAVAGLRGALTVEYGWTELAVQAHVDPPARTLRLCGQVLLPRVREQLRRGLAPLLPPGWALDVAGVAATARRTTPDLVTSALSEEPIGFRQVYLAIHR